MADSRYIPVAIRRLVSIECNYKNDSLNGLYQRKLADAAYLEYNFKKGVVQKMKITSPKW
jgi:hypothetical protein